MIRVLLLSLFLVACAGDPPKVYKPAPETPDFPVKLSWAHKLTEIGSDKLVRLVPGTNDRFVVVADINGVVSNFDLKTGQLNWEKQFDTKFSAGPVIFDDVVLIGSKTAEVYSVSLATGELHWRQRVSSEVISPPQMQEDRIVAQTNDGKIFGLRAKDGKQVWVYERNVPILSLRGNSTPIIIDDQVVAGFANGKLVSLSVSDGKLNWETTVSLPKGRTELERLVDIDGPLVFKNGLIFASAYRGKVAAIDAISGRIVWAREMSSHLGVVIDDKLLFVTDSDGRIWALNSESGATLWMQDKLSELASTRPALDGDNLVVGDVTGELYWLSKTDGRLLGHLEHDKPSKLSGATYYVDEIENYENQAERKDETSVIFQPNKNNYSIIVTYQNGILASVVPK